jgi:hypothetical protein
LTDDQPAAEERRRKPVLLRLDAQVAQAIERLAAQELRSTSGQIEYLLVEALRRRGFNITPGGRRNSRMSNSDSGS